MLIINMKVLWITNILFPEAEQLLTGSGELKASGGWMLGAANALLQNKEVKLIVASVSTKVHKLTKLEGHDILYYILPMGKGNMNFNMDYCKYWRQVNNDVKPDVVHIHGTEYSHGYAYMVACGYDNVVISIQGLTSAYYYYYYYGMSKKDVYSNMTFRDLLRGSILKGQKLFKERAVYEIAMLKMVKHVIGRTSWDKARVWAINPNAKYHFCNETLRAEFYDGAEWKYEKCNKHSIFLSQAGYPIKGLHQVLNAMPLILRHYPDAQIRVAGTDITKSNSVIEKLRLSGYGKYIKSLISKYNLKGKVLFTGNLNAEQMKSEYLNANVFVCPSSIENSPNSLGEAQILGTPCIASYVGGVMDMMKGNEDNIYRFEEIEMLAEKVCRVFADGSKQIDMIETASKRHCQIDNAIQLYHIYQSIKEIQSETFE